MQQFPSPLRHLSGKKPASSPFRRKLCAITAILPDFADAGKKGSLHLTLV
jgi:hypothetical protein